jgi:glyoxylase-like metal-dependent hydrolase (beta-lactamase superfamily II)
LHKIFEDIYSFMIPLPFRDTKTLYLYYIDGNKPALIDTGLGTPDSIDLISKNLHRINKRIKDIATFINTHEHVEHYGGDRKLREISGGSVLASYLSAPFIENAQKINQDMKKHLYRYEKELVNEFNDSLDFDLQVEESKVDIVVRDGDVIDTGNVRLRVIITPGHTRGHICLFDEERKILFVGDHIITKGSVFVGYDYRDLITREIVEVFNNKYNEPDNLSLYIESIRKMQALNPDVILPAHGEPIAEPYKRLEQEIQKKERRSGMFVKVLEKKKEVSLKDLTAKVYGSKKNSLLHCGSALGYLARLNKSGMIEAEMRSDDLYLKIKNT